MDIQTLVLGPLETNCYIVSLPGRSDCVVIDPGDDSSALRRALKGRTVAGTLITHAHYDHILGLPALEDAPVYVHENDAPAMTNANFNMAPPETPAPGMEATHTVKEGDVLSLAGMEFTVLHTSGHSMGSVCYQAGDVLFTGDTLFAHGYGRTDLYGGSFPQLMQSLRRLLRMNIHIYPGHGEDAVFGREGNEQ
jgi:glyoxylase-like metal-dependent hydrolase (beta-lactamase superfamily II)